MEKGYSRISADSGDGSGGTPGGNGGGFGGSDDDGGGSGDGGSNPNWSLISCSIVSNCELGFSRLSKNYMEKGYSRISADSGDGSGGTPGGNGGGFGGSDDDGGGSGDGGSNPNWSLISW
ncbi:hypothetical protein RDABS01_000706 [Bienertia sinuspersici]